MKSCLRKKGDLQLLGARALEGFNLKVDSRSKKLVAAGPIVIAAAVPPRFGELVRVPLREPKPSRKSIPKAHRSKSKPVRNRRSVVVRPDSN